MRDTDFLSQSKYIYVPNKKDPKIILAVDNRLTAQNSLKIFNPFSKKGRILKSLLIFIFYNLNPIARVLIPNNTIRKSQFISYLENKLDAQITTSIYFATAKDKVVVQIQSHGSILGFMKFPKTKRGVKHVKKEYKASRVLSKKKFSNKVLLYDQYQGVPFLIHRELKGKIAKVDENDLKAIVQKFKKENKYQLRDHPRIISLRKKLIKKKHNNYVQLLDKVCEVSERKYHVVYEHGDFAPWNIIGDEREYFVYDFEFFEKNGLEYLDLIKYYFQIGTLLENLNNRKLLKLIERKIPISEIKLLFMVFLIKEIDRKTKENESYKYERELLDMLQIEKM